MAPQIRIGYIMAIATGAVAASSASAQLVSASYNNLAGSWSPGNDFVAAASTGTGTNSSMFVQRLLSPTGSTATFLAGFVAAANPADIFFNISVYNIGSSTASGAGTFTIKDIDGDLITGSITGISTGIAGASEPGWQFINPSAGQVRFNGTLSNVTFNSTNGDGLFEGNFGSWNMNLGIAQPYNGSFTTLTFEGINNFFNTSFSNASTGGSLQIVPTPGAIALLGLGGLMAARRRR